MSYRTNPDRILDNIDRARNRDAESARFQVDRQALGRDLETEMPDVDATTSERLKRIFAILEKAYTKAAQRSEMGRLAARFQAVGDIHHHHARGDVSISVNTWIMSDSTMSVFPRLKFARTKSRMRKEKPRLVVLM